jgi:hypothetical protein
MRDSINFNANAGTQHHSLATRVYLLPVTPVINNIKLLNNDTVRSLSKEQIDELQKRMKKEESRFEEQKKSISKTP